MKRPIRRTICAHPVGPGNRRESSPKPLVPLAEHGVELRPRRERRAGHSEATPAAGGKRETADHPVRSGPRARPRRERLADQGAGSSEQVAGDDAPRGHSPGAGQRETAGRHGGPADEHGGRRCDRRATGAGPRTGDHGAASGRPRARRRPGRTYGSTDARSRGRGNLTAGQADVPRAPRSHTSRGPHQFLWCLLARRTPARHDGMSLAPSRPRLGG